MAVATDLLSEGLALGPWHLNVRISDSLEVADFDSHPDAKKVKGFVDPTAGFTKLLLSVFPNGLEGRTVLDMACNNGAHLFVAKDLGAGYCLGVDVREHWIRQARFLVEHRGDENMEFRVGDLRELDVEPFDIVFFRGVLYHLADPIEGLRIAAGLTRELLVVSSAAKTPEPMWDGFVVSRESPDSPLAGVDVLNWFPTGPGVVMRVLEQFGMKAKCYAWWTPPTSAPGIKAIEVLGCRTRR